MYDVLKRPRWIAGIAVAAAIVILFVNLGLWQLDRHGEVSLENQVLRERQAAPPIELGEAIAAAGDDVETLEWRQAAVTGTFEPEGEILVRNQTSDGVAGFHVVTPLRLEDGSSVLVNRGWVPLSLDRPPIAEAPPPEGRVEVEGVVRLSQERPRFGQVEPEGRLTTVNRIDLDRIGDQIPDLVPVWVQETGTRDTPPIVIEEPSFDDDGPHLEYAFQWFAFAVIGAVGSVLLIRRAARRPSEGR